VRTRRTPRSSGLSGVPLSLATLGAGAFALVGSSVLAPLLRGDLSLGATGVGAIASAGYFGALLTSRFAGTLSDRMVPELVIAGGLSTVACGAGLAALAPGPVIFYLGIGLLGCGYGAINPATSVLANPVAARRRGLAMSLKQSGVPLGGMAAGAVLPTVGALAGWRAALAATGLLCLLVCLWAAISARRSRARIRAGAPPTPHSVPTGVVLRLPLGYAYGLMMAGVQVTLFAMLALFLVEYRDYSAQQAGLGASLLLVGGLLGRPAWGLLSDLAPSRRVGVLQANALLGAAGIAALPFVSDAVLMVALLLVGLGAAGWNGVYIAAVAEARTGSVGGSSGTALTLINVGAVVTPLGAGAIVEHLGGWAYAWSGCAAVALLAALMLGFARYRVPAPRATIPVVTAEGLVP
jgi:MFS family permease